MASDNETVEQVCRDIKYHLKWYAQFGVVEKDEVSDYIDRILAAHERKMVGIIANLNALEKAIEFVCDKETMEKIIMKKKEFENGER